MPHPHRVSFQRPYAACLRGKETWRHKQLKPRQDAQFSNLNSGRSGLSQHSPTGQFDATIKSSKKEQPHKTEKHQPPTTDDYEN